MPLLARSLVLGHNAEMEILSKEFPDFNEKKLGKILTAIRETLPSIINSDVQDFLEDPLIRYLEAKAIDKRRNELEETIENIPPVNISSVSNLYRDKEIAEGGNFTVLDDKDQGVSAGYIVEEDETKQIFMLKTFFKNDADVQTRQQRSDRNDAVRELMGGTLYERLLYNRTPKEGIVITDDNNPELYIRSKFLQNVEILADGYSKAVDSRVKLEGFEKVIAACQMLGEMDYHLGNLMVQDGRTIVKIDHGRSFINFYEDFSSMITLTDYQFKTMSYDKLIGDTLPFNVKEYSKLLNQMVQQLEDDQTDNIIDQKANELRNCGFDFENITLTLKRVVNSQAEITKIKINSEEEFREYYKIHIKENISNMKDIAKRVDKVAKFSNPPPEFENGKWLQAIAESNIKDPVAYAAHYDIQIEGKNALQWAYENNYKIEVSSGKIISEKVKENKWSKNADGKWEEIEVEELKDKREIIAYEPMEYILLTKIKKIEDTKKFMANIKKTILENRIENKNVQNEKINKIDVNWSTKVKNNHKQSDAKQR